MSRWGLGPKVCMHHFGCGMNWIKGYYMIVKVQNETFWFSTYSMEMHSLTLSSFIICLWGETFGSRTILLKNFKEILPFWRVFSIRFLSEEMLPVQNCQHGKNYTFSLVCTKADWNDTKGIFLMIFFFWKPGDLAPQNNPLKPSGGRNDTNS